MIEKISPCRSLRRVEALKLMIHRDRGTMGSEQY